MTVTESLETETPASITELGRRDVEALPGVNADDRLRMVPGFSLFRRSSSVTANPTTQGVSLRGLGSTGASRSLVLWDGVPLNSPFGGWVYWTRIAPGSLERIEVSRGASTSVFGDKAMGGTINLITGQPSRRAGRLGYEGGNAGTHQLEGGLTLAVGTHAAISGLARAFTTHGYYLVPREARGPADTPAGVSFTSASARADFFDPRGRLFVRADMLAEERANGTLLTRNSTGLGTLAANYWREFARSAVNVLAFHTREEYRATFSAIGAGRQTERLTSRQSVPAEAAGAAGHWRRHAARWNLLAGGDYLRSEGYSNETLYPAGSRTAGGVQSQYGLYSQGDAAFGPLRLFGGMRGHEAGSGKPFWMPSGGAALGLERWRLRASAYRAFRAPALNELFRDFRAGNALTLANAALRPEALAGVETGADYASGKVRISVTAFHNRLDGLITNVTRSITPSLITRQRDNAGQATSRGIEAHAAKHWAQWTLQASWLLADSRFAAGERIPQVARHQGSAMATWNRRGTLASAGLRASTLQFEDDRNLYLLPGYALLQFSLRQALGQGLAAVFTLENALNRQVVAGYSPTPQVAAPRLWRAGLRWSRP
jgi:outer membrane cobalamin receptor